MNIQDQCDVVDTTDEIRSRTGYNISNKGRIEVVSGPRGMTIHQHFNVNEFAKPVNDFQSVDFDFNSMYSFVKAVAAGKIVESYQYVDAVINQPKVMLPKTDAKSGVSNLVSQIEYPFLDVFSESYLMKKHNTGNLCLLNPSKGTLVRIDKQEQREFPIFVTADVYGEYKYLEKLNEARSMLGWKQPVRCVSWKSLPKENFYYAGFSAYKAIKHRIPHFIGFEMNPLLAAQIGVKFLSYSEDEDEVRFSYLRSDYVSKEKYYKSHPYYRYCPDVMSEIFARSPKSKNKMVYCHNVISSLDLQIWGDGNVMPVPIDLYLGSQLSQRVVRCNKHAVHSSTLSYDEEWTSVASHYCSSVFIPTKVKLIKDKLGDYISPSTRYRVDEKGDLAVTASNGSIRYGDHRYTFLFPDLFTVRLKDVIFNLSGYDPDMWVDHFGVRYVKKVMNEDALCDRLEDVLLTCDDTEDAYNRTFFEGFNPYGNEQMCGDSDCRRKVMIKRHNMEGTTRDYIEWTMYSVTEKSMTTFELWRCDTCIPAPGCLEVLHNDEGYWSVASDETLMSRKTHPAQCCYWCMKRHQFGSVAITYGDRRYKYDTFRGDKARIHCTSYWACNTCVSTWIRGDYVLYVNGLTWSVYDGFIVRGCYDTCERCDARCLLLQENDQ